jgi:transcriptional regulator with XRE-family HTH domain
LNVTILSAKGGMIIMYLPGTINERICDLRMSKKLSQKELSEIIGVAPSQISRIENGEIQKISGDVLVKLAKLFGVSTDYILGLTAISTPKSYDISELGLSEGAVRALVTGAVDVQIVNRLIAHKMFPYLIHLINAYLSNKTTGGIMARNEIINIATATLGDFA